MTTTYRDLYEKTKDIGFYRNPKPMTPNGIKIVDKSMYCKLHQVYVSKYVKGKVQTTNSIIGLVNHIDIPFSKVQAEYPSQSGIKHR